MAADGATMRVIISPELGWHGALGAVPGSRPDAVIGVLLAHMSSGLAGHTAPTEGTFRTAMLVALVMSLVAGGAQLSPASGVKDGGGRDGAGSSRAMRTPTARVFRVVALCRDVVPGHRLPASAWATCSMRARKVSCAPRWRASCSAPAAR